MLNYLTEKTFRYLVKHKVVDNNTEFENAWLRYGIEITYSSIIGILTIVVLSLLLNSFCEGFVFLCVFVSTRQFTGGYHAETYLKCNISLSLSYVIVVLISKYTISVLSLPFCIAALLLELIAILVFCPIKNRYKPIKSKRQHMRCKAIGVAMFVLYALVGLYLLHENLVVGSVIQYTLHFIIVLCVIGYLKERGYKNEEDSEGNC